MTSTNGDTTATFGHYEEEAIVSLALDFPELFLSLANFITPELFLRIEVKYVIAWILKLYNDHSVIPTRKLLHDKIARQLTADEPYKEILALVDRPSDPREVPIIRTTLKDWARL